MRSILWSRRSFDVPRSWVERDQVPFPGASWSYSASCEALDVKPRFLDVNVYRIKKYTSRYTFAFLFSRILQTPNTNPLQWVWCFLTLTWNLHPILVWNWSRRSSDPLYLAWAETRAMVECYSKVCHETCNIPSSTNISLRSNTTFIFPFFHPNWYARLRWFCTAALRTKSIAADILCTAMTDLGVSVTWGFFQWTRTKKREKIKFFSFLHVVDAIFQGSYHAPASMGQGLSRDE